MKRILALLLVFVLMPVACAREYPVRGPGGGIAMTVTLPEGFDPATDRCPMVILMHGIFSSKDFVPMPALSRSLARAGIASVRFDFNGHGRSEGRMRDMTVEQEIADAMAVWDYVKALPYVERIGFLGHSQGGVIASMAAGRIAAGGGRVPDALVLIAPGAVIKEACQGGKFFNARFDPADPPEYIRCWGMMTLGREYLLSTQELDIYGTASAYAGPVLILHGTRDSIVPLWCSEKYLDTYGEKAILRLVEGENHTITRKKKEVCGAVTAFFKERLTLTDTEYGR